MTLFPGYTRDKPRFAALAAAVLQQVNDLIALVPEMESGLSVAHAVGAQLDALGVSLSIPRQSGWNDETYRSILLRKLRRNQWNGLNESAFEYVDEGETFTDNCNGTVTATTVEAVPAKEVMPVPMGFKTV
jgi:hypothetical protein